MIKLESVIMSLKNCILLNNTSTEVTNGFSLSGSDLRIDNTLIRNFPTNWHEITAAADAARTAEEDGSERDKIEPTLD